MILIDTSAWIEFLRKDGHFDTKRRVADLIAGNEAAYCGPVRFELLAGARGESKSILLALSFCKCLDFHAECWDRAALIERDLRGKGVTVPRDDIWVAAVALDHGVPVYARDGHFELMNVKGRLGLGIA